MSVASPTTHVSEATDPTAKPRHAPHVRVGEGSAASRRTGTNVTVRVPVSGPRHSGGSQRRPPVVEAHNVGGNENDG